MEPVYEFAKYLHVLAAVASLAALPVSLISKKGGQTHRVSGKIYFWGMAAIFVSALVMSIYRPVIFLIGVAVLSFYSTLSGYRMLQFKRIDQPQAARFDWIAAGIAGLSGAGLVGWGSMFAIQGGETLLLGILGIVFGISTLSQVIEDIRRFRVAPTDSKHWWYQHMQRMLGSAIGLLTALSVQSMESIIAVTGIDPSLGWIVWIVPTLVFSPLISVWVNYYRKRFTRVAGQPSAPSAVV